MSSSSSSASADTRSITLSWAESRYIANKIDGIRIRIEATNAANMPAKIFAYQLLPMKPSTGEQVGAFDHICSPIDLEEYPEDSPIENVRPGWYRLDYIDVLVRSRHEADNFLAVVRADVRSLIGTLNIMDEIEPVGSEVIE